MTLFYTCSFGFKGPPRPPLERKEKTAKCCEKTAEDCTKKENEHTSALGLGLFVLGMAGRGTA